MRLIAVLLTSLSLISAHEASVSTVPPGRRVVALPLDAGRIFVSWRYRDSDGLQASYEVKRSDCMTGPFTMAGIFRQGEGTCFVDSATTAGKTYYCYVTSPTGISRTLEITSSATARPCISIPLPGDCTIQQIALGDLNGDFHFELVLLAKERSNKETGSGFAVLAFNLEGECIWKTPVAVDITEGNKYLHIAVWDLDGDGKDEVLINEVKKDSVFAIVGESGCGKSTIARLVLKLLPLTEGKIYFKGEDVSYLAGDALKKFRRSVQIVFQDPFASLNPRMRIIDTLSEPFKIHKIVPKNEMKDRVVNLLEKVGLNADAVNRYPHEFSGGQRQRICIARALTVSPELIVADEPLSALDVSIQAQILNLLQDIKRESAISLIFISHDLKVVHYLSDEVAVMYLGKIVEKARTEDLFESPKHPYTELLLSSAPKIRVQSDESGVMDKGSKLKTLSSKLITDIPSPIDIPTGCPFHPRCPRRFDICDKVVPELKDIDGRRVSCHLY